MYPLHSDLYARTVVDDRRRDATRRLAMRRPATHPSVRAPWRAWVGAQLVRGADGVERLGRRLQRDAAECPSMCLEHGAR